ncbi:hypothetical protein AB0I60_17335 [Actinosynnema sp. NPDC050436]|uniref:hypothetical protein n=1 Tax=Actinosynnema sp. NPDC050436 TaxID=3155659 RepID=UPI0033F11849
MDGNKRTSRMCATTFLALHDSEIEKLPDEVAGQFVLDLMHNAISIRNGALWLLDHVEAPSTKVGKTA